MYGIMPADSVTGRLHPDWAGRPGRGDTWLQWPVPRVDRTQRHNLTNPLVLFVPRSSAVPAVAWPSPSSAGSARRGCAPSRAAPRDPLARYEGPGLHAVGCGPVRGGLSGLGTGCLCADREVVPSTVSACAGPATGVTDSPTKSRPSRNGCACRSWRAGCIVTFDTMGCRKALFAGSGSREPTMCCVSGRTTRGSTTAWNRPRTSPRAPTTMRIWSKRTPAVDFRGLTDQPVRRHRPRVSKSVTPPVLARH